MMKTGFAFLLILPAFLPLSEIQAQEIDYKGFSQWSWHKEDSTEYYLYTPDGLQKDSLYPVALFLHGCCGEDYHATLRNAVDPPLRMWHQFGKNKQTVPTYLIAPKTSRGWRQHMSNLKKVMDDLVKNKQGDPSRIYISGFSMGGEGTGAFINAYPRYFAAAIIMGMTIRANLDSIKDIPLWVNRGADDYYGRGLGKQIADMRMLNGLKSADSANTQTGVNPRFTSFEGVGHGVQWIAASTQDLTGWAYGKINDGNKYPSVFFTSPSYRQEARAGETVDVIAEASDPDGRIAHVEIFVNGIRHSTLNVPPYRISLKAKEGDTRIEAVAYDDKGKQNTAVTYVKVNNRPSIQTNSLPYARIGAYYRREIIAEGNGELRYTLEKGHTLPEGLTLYPNGIIKGMPMVKGSFKVSIVVTDEDGDSERATCLLSVRDIRKGGLLVSKAQTSTGKRLSVSTMMEGETPNQNRLDSVLANDVEEINFSSLGKYEGLTYIKTDINDTANKDENFISFYLSDSATVMVAYEKLDNLFSSTVPAWLSQFTKEEEEIVAQYRYFGVYSKKFPAGKVSLPGANAGAHKIGTHYFIMAEPLNLRTWSGKTTFAFIFSEGLRN